MRKSQLLPPSGIKTCLLLSLLLMTFASGWMDAMCFIGIGRVFSSFMSGNVLFVGIALAKADWDLLWRASASLIAFLSGAAISATLHRDKAAERSNLNAVALGVELVVLFVFALVWFVYQRTGGLPVQIGLLCLAAFAMGLQSMTAMALSIPGVATNAITGTVTLIARLAILPRPAGSPTNVWYLLTLISSYAIGAYLVVLDDQHPYIGFVPALSILSAIVLSRRTV
jgi:uncharacterized membrane protein YoaK (UPF0700 family)